MKVKEYFFNNVSAIDWKRGEKQIITSRGVFKNYEGSSYNDRSGTYVDSLDKVLRLKCMDDTLLGVTFGIVQEDQKIYTLPED